MSESENALKETRDLLETAQKRLSFGRDAYLMQADLGEIYETRRAVMALANAVERLTAAVEALARRRP